MNASTSVGGSAPAASGRTPPGRQLRALLALGAAWLGLWPGAAPAAVQAGPASDPYARVDPAAIHALYSLDFEAAEAHFRRLTVEHPGDPTYWNLLGSAIWLQVVHQQQKLGLDAFAGARMGTDDSNEVVRPEQEAELRQTFARAIAAAEAVLQRTPDNLDALYALGVSHGVLASFEATVKRAYLAAHGEARKAREYHLRVLQLDPGYNDARLTVGVYDYAVGVIPRFVRFMLGVVGVRGGDKEGGIRQLEYAARLGDRAQTNAKVVLVVVYNRERQYEKSLALLRELHAQYPRNYLTEVAIAQVHERMQNWDAAIGVYGSVLHKVDARQDGYDRLDREPVLFRIGEAYVHSHRSERALSYFESVTRAEVGDQLKARAHLWKGKIFDGASQRSRALDEYRAILPLDCDEGLKREARSLINRPFRG